MKYVFKMLFLIPLMLVACSTTGVEKKQGISLSDYEWHLEEARDQNDQVLDIFSNQKVTFNFEKNSIGFYAGCNQHGFHFESQGETLIVGQGFSTLKGCDKASSDRDNLLSEILSNQTVNYSFLEKNEYSPLLLIKNIKNQTLILKGTQTPEKIYGKEAEKVFFEVLPLIEGCKNEKSCIKYRAVYFNKNFAKKTYGEWDNNLLLIEGYEPRLDVREVVRVKKFTKNNSEPVYIFDMVVEQEQLR